MRPAPFTYTRPEKVGEVCDLLVEHGSDAQILAGGQSLMPLLNFRLARPRVLVDITRIADLAGAERDGDVLRVGAATRQRDLELDPALDGFPVLRQALQYMGSVPTRNVGTVGGAVALGDPVAELPVALVTLGGAVTARSQRGSREIEARALYSSYYETVLDSDEVLTEVAFPVPAPGRGTAILETGVRHWGDPTLVVAMATVTMAGGRCTAVDVGLGGVGSTPVLASGAASSVLAGEVPTAARIAEAAGLCAATLDPSSDVHASAAHRRRLARNLTRRVLEDAFAGVDREAS
jgi:carbon-monoxide dehydrogenase medium subunit